MQTAITDCTLIACNRKSCSHSRVRVNYNSSKMKVLGVKYTYSVEKSCLSGQHHKLRHWVPQNKIPQLINIRKGSLQPPMIRRQIAKKHQQPGSLVCWWTERAKMTYVPHESITHPPDHRQQKRPPQWYVTDGRTKKLPGATSQLFVFVPSPASLCCTVAIHVRHERITHPPDHKQ